MACDIVKPNSGGLFCSLYPKWTESERCIIEFMEVNSVAIGLWCYYKAIARMVLKCKHYIAHADTGSVDSDWIASSSSD
jgi:hypothetical protein